MHINSMHLGVLIGNNVENSEISNVISHFVGRVNGIIAYFSSAHSNVKYQLFKTFCMSLYGSPLWDFSGKNVSRFWTTWRKCLRRLLGLPPRTHNVLLPLIVGDHCVETQLHARFVNFFSGALKSSNMLVQLCARLALHGSCSSVCNSLTYICNKYNIARYDVFSEGTATVRHTMFEVEKSEICVPDQITAGCVTDALYLQDQRDSGFNMQELTDIIYCLCTE